MQYLKLPMVISFPDYPLKFSHGQKWLEEDDNCVYVSLKFWAHV